jgi:hypothetical protein
VDWYCDIEKQQRANNAAKESKRQMVPHRIIFDVANKTICREQATQSVKLQPIDGFKSYWQVQSSTLLVSFQPKYNTFT